MKTNTIAGYLAGHVSTFALAVSMLDASFTGSLGAQTPCPEVQVIATGLLGPSKIIQTPHGNCLVAEIGPEVPNSGRVSIVDPQGNRRTLLDGLPSARTHIGDFNGTTGLFLRDRTLYVVSGQGDVTLASPVQGTEKANPTPASPIFSSILALEFPEALELTTTGFDLTLADHQTLKSGTALTVANLAGESTTIRLVADFVDYLPEPRPNFAENVRHSHPYGIVADHTHLYVVDGGFNNVRKVEIATGTDQTLVSFPPTPSPLTNGPPVIENVPTSIHWLGGQLLVTTFGGAPFLPGYSKVRVIDPETGAAVSFIEGLTTAIDSTPLAANDPLSGFLTLEHNLSFPQAGLGQLKFFATPTSMPVTNSACLATPSSMLMDRAFGRLILSELSTGRLVWLPLPLNLTKGETWTRKANMPRPRLSLRTCVSNGRIYALGGVSIGGGATLSTVEEYDPATDLWIPKANMPAARALFATGAVNGRIYAIGGHRIGFLADPLKTVEEYDPATDSWSRKTDMPTAREGSACAVVAGKIYVIGGMTVEGAPALSTVEAYDPATDSWERKADMPTPRGLLCASVVDGRIFAIGAGGPSEFPLLSTVEMYDPSTDTWTRKASMPTARGASAAVTAHGRIYVLGGRIPDAIFALVQEYDPGANTWTRRSNIWSTDPRISVPLFGLGAEEVLGRIYAIGGASGSDRVGLSQVLEYIPPIIAPSFKMNSTPSGLRLEWQSYPDYLDVLQSKSQLEADDWSEVERFSGTGGTPTREVLTEGPASFYRVQRTLK